MCFTREQERDRGHIKAVLLLAMRHKDSITGTIPVLMMGSVSVEHLGLTLHPGGSGQPYATDESGKYYSLTGTGRLIVKET